MDSARGYRLKAQGIADLSRILEDFRADALRLLARRYGALVAARAVDDLDSARLGLGVLTEDPIKAASAAVRGKLKTSPEGLAAADLNCAISLHFVRDAVLARFLHGSEDYRRAWESLRDVVLWGWHPEAERPRGISEKNWEARARYWEPLLQRKGLGETRFVLVESLMPLLGWGGIRRCIPPFETRVARALANLEASPRVSAEEKGDAALLKRRVQDTLDKEISKESFTAAQPAVARPAPSAKGPPPTTEAADRIRQAARSARQDRAKRAVKSKDDPDKVASIDHADVIVSADGRTFVATPYVGLDTEIRVFLQVGDSHIAVSQGGMQFGHVADVPKSAIDLLRACRTVILVEVARKDAGRLLRAKHVAIVSDISLSDNLNISFSGYKRSRNIRGEQEIKEWESGQ